MKSFDDYCRSAALAAELREREAAARRAHRKRFPALPVIISAALSILAALLTIVFTALLLAATAVSAADLPPSPSGSVPQTQAAPAAILIPSLHEQAEEAENERIQDALLARAAVLENVTVTHYCICQACCGKPENHPAYGVTASGRYATPGVSVAVDPALIPLGSDVLADYGDGEIRYYRADDTGSGVSGAHIDLCLSNHDEAIQAGVRTATIYIITEEESEA